MRKKPERKSTRQLAREIANDLITKHDGEHAERLVLIDDSTGIQHGGWIYRALEDRIYMFLETAVPAKCQT